MLVANDTPTALKQSIPGNFYKITTQDPVGLLETLEQKKLPLLDAYIFGKSVRVRIMPENVAFLSEYLPQAAQASLEDAFIYLVQKERAQERSA